MRRAVASPRRPRGFFAAHYQVPPHPTWLSLWESWRRSRLRGVACRRCQCEPDTLVVAPRHWGTPGSIQGGGRTKTFPLGGRWPGEAGSDEGHSVEATTSARKPTPTPHQSKIKDFCQLPPRGKLFLSPSTWLSLGELLPRVTERAVAIRKDPLRPVCALGTSPKGRGKAACRKRGSGKSRSL